MPLFTAASKSAEQAFDFVHSALRLMCVAEVLLAAAEFYVLSGDLLRRASVTSSLNRNIVHMDVNVNRVWFSQA